MHRQKIDPYAAKADFFDGQVCAPWAADTYSPAELAKLERLFAVTGSLDGLRVLEPGCGTGRLTALLARKVGAKGRVVAVDISPCMVAEARRRLSGCHQAEIRLGAVEEIHECAAYFDRVICDQVFPHFEDQLGALSLLARMLKPGGRLVICHFLSSAESNDAHRKVREARIPSVFERRATQPGRDASAIRMPLYLCPRPRSRRDPFLTRGASCRDLPENALKR